MHFVKYTLQIAFIMLGTGIISCSNSPAGKPGTEDEATRQLVMAREAEDREKLDAANAYLSFKEETYRVIEANGQKIADLAESLKQHKENANKKVETDLENLKIENRKLKKSLDEFSFGTTENWDAFKSSIILDIDKVGKSISELAAAAKK